MTTCLLLRGSLESTDNLYFHVLTITNYVTSNDPIYYYNDRVFVLNNKSAYYSELFDTSKYYYSIKKYELGLQTNTSYIFLLSNSGDSINNSNGAITKDTSIGYYDVVTADTTGIITQAQVDSDNFNNMNDNIGKMENTINDTFTNTDVTQDTNNDINNNLNFNNSNNLDSAYTGFFSRLTTLISSLGDYDLSQISSISLPVPHSSSSITLYSNLISSHLSSAITTIIYAFWYFIFGKYFISFIIKIYKLIVTGLILEKTNTNDEVITDDVLWKGVSHA